MKKTKLCMLMLTMAALTACGQSGTTETTTTTAAVTEATTVAASENSAEADQAAADQGADFIDAIDVQERNENIDEQCAEAKEAWEKQNRPLPGYHSLRVRRPIRITSAGIPEMPARTTRSMRTELERRSSLW